MKKIILASLILGLGFSQAYAARKPNSAPGLGKALTVLNGVKARAPLAAQKGLCTAITAVSAAQAGVKPDVPAPADGCSGSEGDIPGGDIEAPGDGFIDEGGAESITPSEDAANTARSGIQATGQAAGRAGELAQLARQNAQEISSQARTIAAAARQQAHDAAQAARTLAAAARQNAREISQQARSRH